MINRVNETLALGDAAHVLCERLRHVAKFAPEHDRFRVGQSWRDENGNWWVMGMEQCASEIEANILVDRLNDFLL